MQARIRSIVVASTLSVCVAAALGALPVPAHAQQSRAAYQFDLPAQPLADTLRAIARQTGANVLFESKDVGGLSVAPLRGQFTPQQAIEHALQGTGLSAEQTTPTTAVIRRASSPNPNGAEVQREAEARNGPATPVPVGAPAPQASARIAEVEGLTVTGTRIRGGSTPSPVITIGAERIRQEGFTDLGQVVRSVPQNFRGGQNPGVIGVSGSVGSQDLTGGSALNLRGLGADASLTLLNGRRLAYDGFAQAVDISAIPVEAVERLEIVPDGASAVYGSDAVGGVANVVLVRDFEGVAVGARYGGATGGGLTTREYTVTAGNTWDGGGLIATLKDTRVNPIYAHQRRYTDHLIRPYTIYNGWDSRHGLLSVHQSIGSVAEVRLDALMTERETEKHVTHPTLYQQVPGTASVVLVSPSIAFFLPRDWSITLGGTYGKNQHDEARYLITGGTSRMSANTGIYNKSRSFELGTEGPLFALGGGDARMALGMGSRTDDFQYLNLLANTGIEGDERARYAYAEISLPFVSAASGIAGMRRLEFSAAIRSEDYDSFGRVSTPKLGVVYGPSADITLKASWGRSFKAPTLNHRYLDKTSYLWTAAAAGGSGYPAGATALMSYGGNADLYAERARTWTAALLVHPEAIPGFDAELTAFDIDYTDRVVEPLNFRFALSNPAYAQFVDYAPTPEQQAALLAVYNGGFYNLSGAAYDPANVVAIIRDQFINAARQRIRGIDLSGSYGLDLGDGRLTLRGSASWLDSKQRTTPGQPEIDLAGTVFNPARFNGRMGAVWTSGGLTVSGFANHTGGVTDQLAANSRKTASFTTLDATLSYDFYTRAGMFSGLTVGLHLQNMLDREPPIYVPRDANYVPYDATNYSAIGRFMSVSVSKRW